MFWKFSQLAFKGKDRFLPLHRMLYGGGAAFKEDSGKKLFIGADCYATTPQVPTTICLKGIDWVVSSCSEIAQNPTPLRNPSVSVVGVKFVRVCVRVALCAYYWLLGTGGIV